MAPSISTPNLVALVADFNARAKKLFESRPYWLINESLVRSAFIEAALEQRGWFPGWEKIDASHICTEAALNGMLRIDLVVRPLGCKPLIVEFKGWNVVTKYDDWSGKVKAMNAASGKVDAQGESIVSDVDWLGRASKNGVRGLMVVYCQHALSKDAADRYAGALRDPESKTLWPWLEERIESKKIGRHKVNVVGKVESVDCKCRTTFSLVTFEVMRD